ncbi:MAG TPA: class I SAM-dependent methyltransferase [Polyangiaceae bacterium]|jgi:ubiquinone/menaquinone biosynthesis C-methylase UbiE
MIPFDDSRYFTTLGAAFVRGRLPETRALADDAALARGAAAGLRLHKFKRNTELPRVRRVLGALRGVAPRALLDVGSGRGTFLWPLLDAFRSLPVTAIDKDPRRANDLAAVTAGGVERLRALCVDATSLPFGDRTFDVVTLLEVLEHIPDPARALSEAVRVAGRFVVLTVPSKEDDNPEHIHLFDDRSLRALFASAGATSVHVEYLRGHILALAHLS